MYNNFDYPAGADTPEAPWNEKLPPEKTFNVCISQTLSKCTEVNTRDYQPEYDEEDGHTYADTSETDWKRVYKEEHYTPKDFIEASKTLALYLIEQGKNRIEDINLKNLLVECEEWCVDETEIVKDCYV